MWALEGCWPANDVTTFLGCCPYGGCGVWRLIRWAVATCVEGVLLQPVGCRETTCATASTSPQSSHTFPVPCPVPGGAAASIHLHLLLRDFLVALIFHTDDAVVQACAAPPCLSCDGYERFGLLRAPHVPGLTSHHHKDHLMKHAPPPRSAVVPSPAKRRFVSMAAPASFTARHPDVLEDIAGVVAGIRPEQSALPTPCDDFDVAASKAAT
jgi:hypothetical protein